jgi:thymidylate synthase ThyX
MSPMPAEKSAYALARYSRSADSILESLEWVRTHNSMKFLESFYFQYGHASIADLGHVGICWEGISELAATEVEDEQLWDGQAKSTRYQDFSKLGFVTPPEFSAAEAEKFQSAGRGLLDAYADLHALKFAELTSSLPRPDDMKPDAYERNLKARAFDVARYVLFFGIPTNVGQVTSIRTLEKQIRRLKASPFAEIREVAGEAAQAVAEAPACLWHESVGEPVAPTLAKYVDADKHAGEASRELGLWAQQNLPAYSMSAQTEPSVELVRPGQAIVDIVASLLYPVTTRPYLELYEWALAASAAVRNEVIDVALRSRSRYDELLKQFRGGQYVFDIVMDIGAYRDLHRHRRCVQLRQEYTFELGYGAPSAITAGPIRDRYTAAMDQLKRVYDELPQPAAQYLLPFGAHSRFLFKMDFAEIEYISKLRSGVKGHFSYRDIAWRMKLELEKVEPELARLIAATPPWEEDPLTR